MPRKVHCKRNQGGGGLGGGWGFTQATPEARLVNNELQYDSIGQCRGGDLRPGFMPAGYSGSKGLPGFSGGGKRKSRKSRKSRKQSGGRYGMGEPDGVAMGTPWGSGLAPTAHVPCEASRSAIPLSGADGGLNHIGSELWTGSPKSELMTGGASAENSLALTQPTAGYSHLQSPGDIIQTAAGTNEMINIPENARVMNQACLKTGGGKSRKERKSRKSRKERKSRKSRKSRK